MAHSVIANNIANVDTPGFKRSEVVFNEQLKSALQARQSGTQTLGMVTTDPGHFATDSVPDLSSIRPAVVTDLTSTLRNDGNNVDIDTEVALLAQNTVMYQSLAQITQHEYTDMMNAITDNVK